MNIALLKSLVALVPISVLLSASVVFFLREKAVSSYYSYSAWYT